METLAYYIALIMIIVLPPIVSFWFIIHPFAHFWRKAGATGTYLLSLLYIFGFMAFLYLMREPLLSIRFGVKRYLLLPALANLIASLWIAYLRAKELPISVLLGLPEVSGRKSPGRLITTGIYSRIRNPRYVEGFFAIAAAAFFSNYLVLYLLWLAYVPVIYAVVILEERELRNRFGEAYERYCEAVPRFLPRFKRAN